MRALNDFGYAVGSVAIAAEQSPLRLGQSAFLWRDSLLTELGIAEFARFSVAFGINNEGMVVGFEYAGIGIGDYFLPCFTPDPPFDQIGYFDTRAFVWEDGVMTGLSSPSAAHNTQARDVNDAGQIAGFVRDFSISPIRQAIIWQNHVLTLLPGANGEAHAINNFGQAVGRAGPFGRRQAALWQHGDLIELGTLGGEESGAWDINNHHQVVGWSLTQLFDSQGCRLGHAFLWQDGQLIDLNDRLPPDLGWELLEARAINDRGEIVGTGLLNGEWRGFLLTPITGDADGDGDVDLADLLTFDACFSGPGVARADDPACREVDLDADGDVDLADLVAFQANFTGSQ